MEDRDYNYYEANAGVVRMEDITSSPYSAMILKLLRDDKREYISIMNEKDFDLGWLGYFIGKSKHLRSLSIHDLPKSEGGGQQTHAFLGGIARNQSIRFIAVHDISDDMFEAVARVLSRLSQLEDLGLSGDLSSDFFGRNGCSTLGALLETGFFNLKKLWICGSNINDDGVAAFANGLASIGSSLKELDLQNNAIGNGGLSALVAALATCTSLETLDLSGNDLSLAATGLRSLSDWLQRAPTTTTLNHLRLVVCAINDEGLQALAQGAANHCATLDLSENYRITASGLQCLSTSLQSESCRVETLDLQRMSIGDDGAKVLALGLIGNTSLRSLHLDKNEDGGITITPAGWSAFSTALCDTSSVNNIYLSNHTLRELDDILDEHEDWDWDRPDDIDLYLQLNKEHPQHAAKCKILMNHPYLDMMPFFQWKLKFLPLAVDWFERARPCMTLSIYDNNSGRRRILEESDEAFQSRVLTAVYQFVRGMPMEVMKRREELILVAAYDEKIARIEEEKKSLRERLKRRKRKIKQLEAEKDVLSGIVEAVRNSVGF
jgi:Ran GTPase-activating protein (RanGAP) involved in mRNA processing and transport